MIKAVEKIGSISRKECRKHVEKKFNLKNMVDAYEKVYYEIIDERNKSPLSQAAAKNRSRIPT